MARLSIGALKGHARLTVNAVNVVVSDAALSSELAAMEQNLCIAVCINGAALCTVDVMYVPPHHMQKNLRQIFCQKMLSDWHET